VAGLALLTLVAFGSRFWRIAHKSIWLDEAVSWRFARASIPHMLDLTTTSDVHPPLYYGVLHYWTQLAGDSEASLRAPSAAFGAATIVLLGIAAWRINGWLLALAASLLLLTNGAFLFATQTARMYPMVGLLTLASSLSLAGFAIKPSVPRFGIYAALAIALVYTHYSGFIALAAHGGVFAVYGVDRMVRKRDGWILVAGLALVVLVVLAYIPWWSTFRHHPATGGGYPDISAALLRSTGRSALGLDKAGRAWIGLALPPLLLGIVGVARRWRDPRVLSVGAIALVPVGQILASILFEPVFTVRQVVPYIPGLAFICALGFLEAALVMQRLRSVSRLAASVVIVAFAGCMLAFMFKGFASTYTAPPLQDWRSAAEDVAGRGELIYVAPGYQWQSLAYYRGSSYNLTPIWQANIGQIVNGALPVPESELGHDAVLVAFGAQGDAVAQVFKQYFDVNSLQRYGSNITVYYFSPTSGAP
jgi:hypothetical protein